MRHLLLNSTGSGNNTVCIHKEPEETVWKLLGKRRVMYFFFLEEKGWVLSIFLTPDLYCKVRLHHLKFYMLLLLVINDEPSCANTTIGGEDIPVLSKRRVQIKYHHGCGESCFFKEWNMRFNSLSTPINFVQSLRKINVLNVQVLSVTVQKMSFWVKQEIKHNVQPVPTPIIFIQSLRKTHPLIVQYMKLYFMCVVLWH